MNEQEKTVRDEQNRSLREGFTQGQTDVDTVTAGGLDDVKLERLIKEYIEQTGQNISVADVMDTISIDEFKELLEPSITKARKLKDVSKTVGKLLGGLLREKNGEMPLLKRLQSLTKMERDKILKELKDIPEEKYAEIIAVIKAFAPLALNTPKAAEYTPMYLKFINGLFRKKNYLNMNSPGSGLFTELEEDLKSFAAKDVGVVRDIILQALARAYQELNSSGSSKTLAGMKNLEEVQDRLIEVVPDLVKTTQQDMGGDGSIQGMIEGKSRDTQGGYSFEAQRVAKLHNDLATTLNNEVTGLLELEASTSGVEAITVDGVTYNAQDLDKMLGHFANSQTEQAEWFKTSNLLEKYLHSLEQSRSGTTRDPKAEQKIAKLKSLITSRNALDLIRNSGNIASNFVPMYERHFSYEIAKELGKDKADLEEYKNLTDEQKTAVSERTATRVREAVLYTVSNIYRNYLSSGEDPKEDFRQTLQHTGDPYLNPTEMFKQFTNMLTNLAYQAKQVRAESVDFTVLSLGDMTTVYNPDLRKNVTTFTSQRKQKRGATVYDFMKELLATVKTDDGFFEAGHQYRFLSNMGSPDQNKSFFGSIGEYLRYSMSSENIDRIYAMENAGDIVRVASIIEAQIEKRLAEKGWLNEGEGKMFEEIFLNKGEGGSTLTNYILNYLRNYYPEMPEWQRQRVMQHAFTIVFAGRFRFQQIYSYANPTRGFQGQAEDKQMFNSVFSPFHKLLRYPPEWKHDFALRGVLWNPRINMPGFNYEDEGDVPLWDAEKMGKEGFGVFNKGDHQRLGRLAWDMTHFFHDDVPFALGPTNELQVGGYDTLRGWRRYADLGVIDKRLYKLKAQGGMPEFTPSYKDGGTTKYDGVTRLWKSIENIGSNDLLAFVNGDIADMFKYSQEANGGKGGISDENMKWMEDFIRFLYRRYLGPSNPLSRLFPHTYLTDKKLFTSSSTEYFTDENEFVNKFKDIAQNIWEKKKDAPKRLEAAGKELQGSVVKPMMQSALMCIVAERSPTVLMNRLKPQDEQNGLTLNSEIRNQYWKDNSSFLQNLTTLGGIDQKVSRSLSGSKEDKDKLLMSYWDQTENDLIMIQADLRAEVDKEILSKRSSWEAKSGGANIYGENFNELRSSVNGGKGYVLDEDTLIRLMIKKERPEMAKDIEEGNSTVDVAMVALENSNNNADKALALRIRRVQMLHNDILSKLAEMPGISEDEAKLEKDLLNNEKNGINPKLLEIPDEDERKEKIYKAKRLLENKKKRMSRMTWFQKMLSERFLGAIPFMVDNSEIHKTFLNADNTMVFRSTGDSGVAEQYKLILDPRAPESGMSNMLVMMKDAARKGTPAEWGKLKSLITGFRKICSDEIGDGDVFMPVVLGLIKMQLIGFTNKQEVRNALGRWKQMFTKEGQSLFSNSYTWFEHHGFDAISIRQYLMTFTKVNAINPDNMEMFANMFQASWWGVAKEVIPEYLTYIFAYIMVTYISEAVKKEAPK
ncbi:MAG: hypothetical protein U0525_00015 [Patescibacteria group bacterium]